MHAMNVVLFVCFQFLYSTHLISAETPRSPQRVPSIRAAYFHLTDPERGEEQLKLLQQHGFNTALVADGSYQLKEELWRAWGHLAEKYDVQLFAVLNFAVPREFREVQGRYRPYVNRKGVVYQKTPCPLDEDYWNAIVRERLEQFVWLSIISPIAGVMFDSEMYGSDISLYNDLCYCDTCWQAFTRSLTSEAENHRDADFLPKAERFDYLEKHDLLRQYTLFQWKRVRSLFSRIEQQVHRIRPHLRLGIIMYAHTWFYHALVQGLGTAESPILVFSESSYVRGYTPYVDREREQATGSQNIAHYVPGLWLHRFFPRDLPAQLTNLAIHTDGYWIYTADSLWSDTSKSGRKVLHGRHEDYWAGLQEANDILLRLERDPDSSHNTIPSIPASSFYDRSHNRLFMTTALKELLAQFAGKLPVLPESITYREETLFHCLTQTEDESTVRITHVPFAKEPNPGIERLSGNATDPIRYTLFGGDGQVLQEGRVEHDQGSTMVTIPTGVSGHISLMTAAGVNAARVALEGLACVVEASSTFPLTTINTAQDYRVYVNPEQQWLKLRAFCGTEHEFAALTVTSPDGAVRQRLEVVGAAYGFAELQAPLSPASPPEAVEDVLQDERNFRTLTVAPVPSQPYSDVRFYLYDAEFPYLWPIGGRTTTD